MENNATAETQRIRSCLALAFRYHVYAIIGLCTQCDPGDNALYLQSSDFGFESEERTRVATTPEMDVSSISRACS